VCFTNFNPYNLGEECEFEVCLDIQVNTGDACECPYSVTQVCQTIPFGESYCFDLELLDLPLGDNYCASILGSKYNLGGNVATVEGIEYPEVTYFEGEEYPCNKYSHLLFTIGPAGEIILHPTYTVGMMNTGESNTTYILNMDLESEETSIQKSEDQGLTEKMNIFPNPVHSLLNIELSSPIQTIQLYSNLGELVLQNKYTNQVRNQVSLDVSEFANGSYIIRVQTTDTIETQTIIITH